MSAVADTRTRLIALVAFVALPLALIVFSAVNLVAVRETSALAETTEQQAARLADRTGGAGPQGTAENLSAVFVAAGSRSLAEADLQRQIVSIIERSSATVIESVAAEPRTGEAENAIRVRATFDIGNDALLRLLREIETGLPLMFVEEIAIRRLQNDGAAGGVEPVLRVDLRVRSQYRDIAT